MYLLRSPFKNWLTVCLFLAVLISCDMDDQFSIEPDVNEEEITAEENQDISDSERFRIGNLVYEETFEGNNPLVDFIWRQLPGKHSFTVANSPILEGKRSGRFELKKNDR